MSRYSEEELDKILPKKNNEQGFVELEEDSPELNKMIGYNAAIDDCRKALLQDGEGK